MNELQEKFSGIGIDQIKSNIQRTIMSYRNPWDIYTEPLQNSADAVIDKFGFENIKEGNIELEISTNNRKIVIKDNGVGIKGEDIPTILVMGESLKRKENRGKYGFMGYGFTFVAFQTEFLKIESVHNGKKSTRTYRDLYKFIFDDKDLPSSQEETNGKVVGEETNEDSYTNITLIFPKCFPDETLENNIKLAFDYTKNTYLIDYILRTQSPVGLVDSLFDKDFQNFKFKITIDEVVLDIKNKILSTREIIETLYPNSSIYDMDSYKKFINSTEHLNESIRDMSRQCILIDSCIENIYIGERHPISARLYIASTSKDHLNEYSKKFTQDLAENYGNIVVENGIWLSIDGLPTGICLDNFNHPNFLPFTCIVDIDGINIRNELDSGRKGITAYRVDQICKMVKSKLRERGFISYRHYVLGTQTRTTTYGYDAKKSLSDIFNQKNKLNINLNMQYDISNEQEVICLFTELVVKELLIGYKLKVLSSYEVYDGLYEYILVNDEKYIAPSDRLGISRKVHNENDAFKKDIIVEFKYVLRSLFNDIRVRRKNANDIDIIVCWDVEYDKVDEFAEKEGVILKEVNTVENIYYGVTHEVISPGRSTVLPIIELKTVLKRLFD